MIKIRDRRGQLLAVVKADHLAGSNLEGFDLSGADLVGADLRFSNLTRTNLQDANLKNSDLSKALLLRANLTNANLEGSHLSGTIFDYARMVNTNLADSLMVGAMFNNTDLTEANLSGSDLRLASFEGANLHGANMEATISASIWFPDDYPVGTFSRTAFRNFIAYVKFAHKWMDEKRWLKPASTEDLHTALNKLVLAKDKLAKHKDYFESMAKKYRNDYLHNAVKFAQDKLGDIIKILHHSAAAAETKQALNSLTGVESMVAQGYASSGDMHQTDTMPVMKEILALLGDAHKALKDYFIPMELHQKLEELKKKRKMMKFYPAKFKDFGLSPEGFVDKELEKELFGYEEKMEKKLEPGYTIRKTQK